MLSLPTSSRSYGSNGTPVSPSLANDTQVMVLEYLAAECMETTLLSLVGHHPLAIQCLNTVRLPSTKNQALPVGAGHQISPQVIQVDDSSDEDNGISSSGDVTMDNVSDYAPSPAKRTTHQTRPATMPNRPLATHARLAPTTFVPVEQVIGRLSFHLRTLRVRKELKSLILAGQVQGAKSLLLHFFLHFSASTNPLTSSSEAATRFSLLLARLDCQSFIELIRVGNHAHTLSFSQSTLSPYLVAARQPDATPTAVAAAQLIGQVYGLIAYPDPYVSPLADFLDARHRQRLAEDTNLAVLASANQDGSMIGGDADPGSFQTTGLCGGPSALEKAVRQAMVAVMAKGASPAAARETVLL